MMTPEQIVSEISVFLQSASPLLPPGVALAANIAVKAMQAVQAAQNGGKDVTPEQLAALFAADKQAIADDLVAQEEAKAKKTARAKSKR